MPEKQRDNAPESAVNPSWMNTSAFREIMQGEMTPGFGALSAHVLQKQEEQRQQERTRVDAEQAAKSENIFGAAPRLRRMVVVRFLLHLPYWSSLETAFLMLPPSPKSDPMHRWREMLGKRLAEGIKEKWPLWRKSDLTQVHSQVLIDFGATSNEPIEIPRAKAAKYLLDKNLPYLTDASFPKVVLDEVRAFGNAPEVLNGIMGGHLVIPDLDDPAPPALSEQQQDILRVLAEYSGDPNKRMSRDKIAEALPQGEDGDIVPSSESINRAISGLMKYKLISVKRGRGGGYWLSDAGHILEKTLADKLEKSGP
jgi:hypothetical protein